jgi:alpha-tubulin suppressor-like RCC1 family protein
VKRYRIASGVALTATLFMLLFSATALAAAKSSVSLKASPSRVTVGQALKLTGTVAHTRSGFKTVTILKEMGTKWQTLATAKLSSKHAFAVKETLAAGKWHFRARYKAGSKTVLSKVVTVTVDTWTAVSAGYRHTMALKSDGTLWAWGNNDSGQLGLGNTTAKDSPTQVEPGSTWKVVSAGWDYTLAIKTDGSLWAWGVNNYGQLGLGAADGNVHATPTQVAPGTTWKAVSCGMYDTLAIQSNGSLWAWGWNESSNLGLGNQNEVNTPTQVGGLTTWTSVSSGDGYTLAIQSNGSLWGCGDNMVGELGLGNSDGVDIMTAVNPASTWAAAATCGSDSYSLVIKSDGSLWGCGRNDSYELGIGSDASNPNTLTAVDPGSTWKSVSCGDDCTLAVKTDGSLWAWGFTTSGNLGLGHTGQTVTSPTRVGTGHTWTSVSAGYEQTVALKSDGSLWAWGDNFYGDLGLGNWLDKDVPTEVGGSS